MNIDHITPSILHVTASSELNIQKDLESEQTKSIAELLDKDNNETKEDQTNEEKDSK